MSEIMEYTYPICKNVLLAFFRLHGCRFSNSLPLKKTTMCVLVLKITVHIMRQNYDVLVYSSKMIIGKDLLYN